MTQGQQLEVVSCWVHDWEDILEACLVSAVLTFQQWPYQVYSHRLKCSLAGCLATPLVQVEHCTVANKESGERMPPWKVDSAVLVRPNSHSSIVMDANPGAASSAWIRTATSSVGDVSGTTSGGVGKFRDSSRSDALSKDCSPWEPSDSSCCATSSSGWCESEDPALCESSNCVQCESSSCSCPVMRVTVPGASPVAGPEVCLWHCWQSDSLPCSQGRLYNTSLPSRNSSIAGETETFATNLCPSVVKWRSISRRIDKSVLFAAERM